MNSPDLFRGPTGRMPPGPTVQVEAWILSRLGARNLFDGVTTPDDRRERLRAYLVNRQMQDAIAGRRKGQTCESWSDLFERLYGEPLVRRAAA